MKTFLINAFGSIIVGVVIIVLSPHLSGLQFMIADLGLLFGPKLFWLSSENQ